MRFLDRYRKTGRADPTVPSALQALRTNECGLPSSGVYEGGLLAVVDEEASHSLLGAWSSIVPRKCRAVVATGFGDVFFWEEGHGVSLLEVQRASVEFIDSDLDWFVNNFLLLPDIEEHVLRQERFTEVTLINGFLAYHDVFILEPWPMLGGDDRPENYGVGTCAAYLDLVAASLTKVS